MTRLQIQNGRERTLVRLADGALLPFRRARRIVPPVRRVLLLRLERIGDLVMALPAIANLRAALPDAEIDLVVGSWNVQLARCISGITRVETMDAAWLSRGARAAGVVGLLSHARGWRTRRYDLGINFEPDLRSNLLLRASAARVCAGFESGGGGPLLDVALEYNPHAYVSDNACALVRAVAGAATGEPSLVLPQAAVERAMALCDVAAGPLAGIHVSAGRLVKQWPPERFGAVAAHLASRGAIIVFTGDSGDRPLVNVAKAAVPASRVVDLTGNVDLVTLAAVLARLDLLVTVDTGPMHLAHAMGVPVVAVFGPSDPGRYSPGGVHDRVVRVDLPCSPCNRIRVPPARCTGHVPECLSQVTVATVTAAVDDVLRDVRGRRAVGSS